MSHDDLIKDFDDQIKAFQSLNLRSEENHTDLITNCKIVTSLSDIINYDIISPLHPLQFLEVFKSYNQNMNIMHKNIETMKEYFFLSNKNSIFQLKNLKKELLLYLRKFELLRLQKHKYRERQDMFHEEKSSYLKKMKRILNKTEVFSNQNLQYEKALIDLKNETNTFSIREHNLYVKIVQIDKKIDEIQEEFPEKSRRLPLLYKEYEALIIDDQNKRLVFNNCKRLLNKKKDVLLRKINLINKKIVFIDKVTEGDILMNKIKFFNLKEIHWLITSSNEVMNKLKESIAKETNYLNLIKPKFMQVYNEVELSKKVAKDKGSHLTAIDLNSIEALQKTFIRLQGIEVKNQEELHSLEKSLAKQNEKLSDETLISEKLEKALTLEMDKDRAKKLVRKSLKTLREFAQSSKEEKSRLKLAEKSTNIILRPVDSKIIQNRKVCIVDNNSTKSSQVMNSINIFNTDQLNTSTNPQNTTTSNHLNSNINDNNTNYQSIIKAKGSLPNTSFNYDAPKKTGMKKGFILDSVEGDKADFREFDFLDGIAKGIQEMIKQPRTKKDKKRPAYENYINK